MARVHWLGAGLSSGPGIRRMAESGQPLTLWNRTVEKAHAVLAETTTKNTVDVRQFSLEALTAAVAPGDVVVSMLPATMHPEIATACLEKSVHFVSTSYISDAMRKLDGPVRERGLSFVNEAGLDPGLDHMLAHKLVAEYRQANVHQPGWTLSFRSLCGGFPKVPNEFRYKFSWSPAGVLRALKNPARYVKDGAERNQAQPWKDLFAFSTRGETFEVYPNRDSIPYVTEYGFPSEWKLAEFIRGTIRLAGWANAWSDILAELPSADEASLSKLSHALWSKHSYREDEPDRVVLYVALTARDESGAVRWSRAYCLDETGTRERTAMGYLVSMPATFAVDWIVAGKSPRGVSGPPQQLEGIDLWLRQLEAGGARVHVETTA